MSTQNMSTIEVHAGERFHTHDQRQFRTVGELQEILQEWLTAPGSFSGLQQGYAESGDYTLTLATLFSERLSDGSYVYGVRLA